MPSSKKAAKKAAKRAKAEEASKKRALARASARAAAKSSKDKKNGNLGDKLRFLTYNSDDAIDQLHQSARYGEVSTVVAILDQGLADVDVTGEYEGKPATALLLAATGRQPGTTAALLRAGADPKFRTTDGPILHLAAAIPDNVEVLKILTAHPDIDVGECCPMGRSPLSWATRFGDVENVKALLDYCKADVSLSRAGVCTSVACATIRLPLSLHRSAMRHSLERLQFKLLRALSHAIKLKSKDPPKR